jgi:hypothetical protein
MNRCFRQLETRHEPIHKRGFVPGLMIVRARSRPPAAACSESACRENLASMPPLITSGLSARLLTVTMLAQPIRHAMASLPVLQPQRNVWRFLERSNLHHGVGFLTPMTVLPKLSKMASAIHAPSKEFPYDFSLAKSSTLSISKFQPIKLAHNFRAFSVRRMNGGSGDATATERTEEEKERLKAEREQRKAAKEAEAAAKKARKEAEAKAAAEAAAAEAAAMRVPIEYLSQQQPPDRRFADYSIVASRSETGRHFSRVQDLGAAAVGSSVWIRARVAGVRGKGG